ncbi:MAG TPA: SPOR domain-containing protein, partial [Prolixibacteraceae bacterium]|nr:SPOR domain-containing protein [Prolixibacteraceae bacterium]
AEPDPSIFRPFAETLPENPEVTAAEDETALPEEKDEGIVYKIQLGSFIREIPAKKKAMFDKISKIRIIDTFVNEEGATVYTTGNLANFEDAITLQNQVRQEGIKDAFVIAMKNGKRVSLPNKAP